MFNQDAKSGHKRTGRHRGEGRPSQAHLPGGGTASRPAIVAGDRYSEGELRHHIDRGAAVLIASDTVPGVAFSPMVRDTVPIMDEVLDHQDFPYSLTCADVEQAKGFVNIHKPGEAILRHFPSSKVTLVTDIRADNPFADQLFRTLHSGNGTGGIRISGAGDETRLIRAVGNPLVNAALTMNGHIATTIDEAVDIWRQRLRDTGLVKDLVVVRSGGPRSSMASSVIELRRSGHLDLGRWVFHRQGDYTEADAERDSRKVYHLPDVMDGVT